MAIRPIIGPGGVAAFGLLGIVLCALWAANFLLFHTLAELFSVVVAFAATAVAWYSRDWIGRNYLLLLGLGQFFVGGIDVLHTVSYKGVGIIDARGGNLPTQLWLAGRGFEAVCFLVAVWVPQRRYGDRQLLSLLSLAWLATVGAIFADWAPAAFIPGQGVTPLKMAMELVLVAAFAGIALRLRSRSADYDPRIYTLLMISVTAKMLTELSFCWYIDVYGLAHLIGHAFKIISAWAFLKAVVESGLSRPQSMIFGALERERALSGEVARHARTLNAVLDAALDPVLMLDDGGRVRFASRAAEVFLERGNREMAGRGWREAGLPAALMNPLETLARQVLSSGRPRTEEASLPWRGGQLCLELQVAPVAGGAEGAVPSVVAVLRDVTARKAMEQSLRTSIEDNRELVQEVHHRVNNNLQIVSSILQMEGWRSPDPAIRQHFDEACGRILTLARVHESIHQQDAPASLDFAQFARALCDDLLRQRGLGDGRIALSVGGAGLKLGVGRAEPLALIVHELVVEALKHVPGGGGHLRIDLSEQSGEGVVVVADDGGQGDRSLDFDGASVALGLRMVGALVKQMRGTVTVTRRQGGVEVEVRFPLAKRAEEEG